MTNYYPLTLTKLIIPSRRDEILTRQRLIDTLDDLLELKLVIIAAPAGYGKTSLLIDFADHSNYPIGWLAIDELDKDPFRFVSHLIAAINNRFPNFGQASFSFINHTEQEKFDINAMVMVIVNDIYENITEHFLMILDDFQFVEESEVINQFINQLLLAVSENCHFIISSRRLLTIPDMPLLVARNQVGGISFEEIAFSANEIQELLLKNYHVTVSNQAAEDITKETEGWVTGLLLSTQLFGEEISKRIHVARVSGVGLFDYLAQQVFDQQPQRIKDFLLRTSLLEDFSASRCERVIDKCLNVQLPWRKLIEEVISRNLFVQQVSQGSRSWLRYHHLFRDFLYNKMRQERKDESREILIALADDYQKNKNWDHAFDLYQEVGATDNMVELVAHTGSVLVTTAKFRTLKKWLDALPPEIVNVEPVFISLKGAILINLGELSQGIILFSEVIERLQRSKEDIEILLLSLIRRAVSNRMIGNYALAHEDSQTALDLLENYPQFGQLRAEALRNLGLTHYYQGDVRGALNVLKQSLYIFESYKDQENIPIVLFNIALLHKVLGDYDLAEEMYQKAFDYWQSGANLAWLADISNNLGILQQLRGDFCSAAANFEKAIEYSRIGHSPRGEGISLASLGDLYRDLDAYNEALDVYKRARSIAEQQNDGFLLFYLDLAEGALYNISDELKKSHLFFERASNKAKESGSAYNLNLLNSELAMSHLRAGEYKKANSLSKNAHEYFEKEGHNIESLRSAMTCAVALLGLGDPDNALSILRNVVPLLLEDKYATPLTIQIRYVKEILESVKGNREVKNLISQIIERVNTFEENLVVFRRKIRQQAKIVPFEPPRLIIQSFGKAQVFLRDQLVTNSDWQTQNAKELFYLFLAHPRGLTKEQVGLYFWPDASPDELKLRFKNGLYRLRRALGGETILLDEDYYRFNWSLDYEYDVEKLKRNIELSHNVDDLPEKIELVENAIKVYEGEYLSEFDGSWVVAPRRQYHQIYIEALMQLANIAMVNMDFKSALSWCNKAISEDPCLEDAHRLAMRIHSLNGNRAAIVRQYENCLTALSQEINVPPSRQTSELYETLIRQ